MYFPIGWPKCVNLALPGESDAIKHLCFDAVKILLAGIGADFLGIWYANPLIPIVYHRRSVDSLMTYGTNKLVVWKPDSKKLVILTSSGALLLYEVGFDSDGNGIFLQIDPPATSLRRDSAELFIKENIPQLTLREVGTIQWEFIITTVCCISLSELLVANDKCELLRVQWSELSNLELNNSPRATIKLRNIPFYVSQQCSLKSVPAIAANAYIATLEYSPFIGGCAAVFSDKRAAFLIANHLRFETETMHGFWISDVEDATVCGVNHKFRLLAFGRHNSDVLVYGIEDTTGGIEFSHRLSLNSTTVPCSLGEVSELKWSPDGCVLVVAWSSGGIAMWSTFGALLMSSFNWDFGLHVDLVHNNPIRVSKLEWSTEGYQLFMTCQAKEPSARSVNEPFTNVWQLNFVKSTLAMNPCMASHAHLLLQGDDTLYLNQGDNLEKIYFGGKFIFPNNQSELTTASQCRNAGEDDCIEVKCSIDISNILAESKYWTIIQLPQTYAATNWPIRYSAIDADGIHVAVAGRTGLAHYSIITKKWKLFGNESQEKDFVVSGGLLWWKGFIVTGCYSLLDHTDEIRCYPEECKLDNQFGNRIQVRAPVISLNMFQNQLIALTADGIVSLFDMHRCDAYTLKAECAYEVDVKSICVHPACIVSLMVTNLRSDFTSKTESSSASSSTSSSAAVAETIIVNVCGRILMIHRDNSNAVLNSLMASCLASCVECFWLSNSSLENSPMRDCLWLFSGAHGMRVWLPILPPISNHEQRHSSSHRLHTFMSKRIMLSFPLKLYPLVILFDNVIVLGVDNETTLYMSETQSHFSLPFSHLERKSQVYLHKILRQLIKRNLGYSAWEIAQSCRHLPYFPHSLELLLHEVLEEEATSKEPIPDALLPSVLDFIREFPVYLQTIVQCARKTEIALWPHLFSIAGKPKHLFQKCLETEELVTAASYLIILQNLEPSIVSKQYATLLLEVALKHHQWELARDLIRFLKAIDPNEIDSPRSSMVVNVKIAPQAQSQAQVNPNADAFDLILGPIVRERSFSTTVGLTANMSKSEKKEKALLPPVVNESTTVVVAAQHSSTAAGVGAAAAVVRRKSVRNGSNVTALQRRETFSIETILQRHARQLLQNYQLINLGYMSAFLDFHLVTWLSQEANKTACLDDYVAALVSLHEELHLPRPVSPAQIRSNEEVDRDGEYAQLQRKYNIDQKVAALPPRTSSQTSESGYFSLALMDTPNSTAANNGNVIHISSIKENEVMQYSIQQHQQQQQQLINNNSNTSLDNSAVYERQRYCSVPDGDISASSLALAASNDSVDLPRILPEKLAIKMRYLLQLFIEANCVDFALVLSILLQDAASIGRIINVVIRSESLMVCERIQQRLKCVTEWTFEGNCTYRTFMTSLQPHIYLLDQYTMQSSESKAINSNRLSTADNGHHATNLNNLNGDSLNKLLPNNHNNHHNNKTSSSWSFDNYTEHEQHFNASNQNSTPNSRRYALTGGRATSLDQATTGRTNCHVM